LFENSSTGSDQASAKDDFYCALEEHFANPSIHTKRNKKQKAKYRLCIVMSIPGRIFSSISQDLS
jgi:hypothetical protein